MISRRLTLAIAAGSVVLSVLGISGPAAQADRPLTILKPVPNTT